jgi:hypothetical protein
VRLDENSTTFLIVPEFRDLMSRQAEIVVNIRSRECFRARSEFARPRSGAVEHPAEAPRVPPKEGLLAVHIGGLELALNVGREFLNVILVSAKLVGRHLKHA